MFTISVHEVARAIIYYTKLFGVIETFFVYLKHFLVVTLLGVWFPLDVCAGGTFGGGSKVDVFLHKITHGVHKAGCYGEGIAESTVFHRLECHSTKVTLGRS